MSKITIDLSNPEALKEALIAHRENLAAQIAEADAMIDSETAKRADLRVQLTNTNRALGEKPERKKRAPKDPNAPKRTRKARDTEV